MKEYHKRVQKGIRIFAEQQDCKSDFVHVSTGSKIVYIHHPTNRKLEPLEYKPDAILTVRNRRMVFFQVLDTQAKKNREIEADIIRSFLSPEVSIVVFVTESKDYAKRVERISSIISENLVENGTNRHMIPITIALAIPRSIRKPSDTLRYFNKIKAKLTRSY